MPPANRYVSFLLRMQWMSNESHPVWIASTQSTRTGELHWFPTLDALIQFLQEEFGDAERVEGAQENGDDPLSPGSR